MTDIHAFPTMGRFIEADGMKLQEASAPGMTLRDYFAAKALMGICERESNEWKDENTGRLAKIAYKLADAMLVEREKS